MLFWVWKQRSLRKVRLRYVLGKDILISVRVIVDARVMCKKSPNVNPPLNKETLLAVRSVLEHNRRQKKNKVLSHMSLLLGGGGIILAMVPLKVLIFIITDRGFNVIVSFSRKVTKFIGGVRIIMDWISWVWFSASDYLLAFREMR